MFHALTTNVLHYILPSTKTFHEAINLLLDFKDVDYAQWVQWEYLYLNIKNLLEYLNGWNSTAKMDYQCNILYFDELQVLIYFLLIWKASWIKIKE